MALKVPLNTVLSTDAKFQREFNELRDLSLAPAEVRARVAKLTSRLVANAKVETKPGEKLAVIVVLRSGLAMYDAFMSELAPETSTVTYHIGMFRERYTLQPVEYYNKLPPKPVNITHAYVLDPVIATGGTAEAVISILRDWGVPKVTFVSLLASAEGLGTAANVWPEGTDFIVGVQDPKLNSKGYIEPGLGDIGDRLFGTA
jgi:uracil phosphoribosyltransferase